MDLVLETDFSVSRQGLYALSYRARLRTPVHAQLPHAAKDTQATFAELKIQAE